MWYNPEMQRGMGTASASSKRPEGERPAGQEKVLYQLRYTEIPHGVKEEISNTTYRLYLGGNNTKDYNLLRNHAYTVNVTL